jgi:hypothetical protein
MGADPSEGLLSENCVNRTGIAHCKNSGSGMACSALTLSSEDLM